MAIKSSSVLSCDARHGCPAMATSLLAVLLLGLFSCTTPLPGTYAINARRGDAPGKRSGSRDTLGPIQSSVMDVDYFQGLMVRAGVPPHALPKDGHRITQDEALQLLSWLLSADVKMRDFGPWRMASHLLWEVVTGEETVSRRELYERMHRFASLLVLRPDGYLVLATTGEALQYVDTVRLEDGALRSEGFEVGPFYTVVQRRFLYSVDGSLTRHPDARVAGIFNPDDEVLGPAVEGAGLAVADTVTGIVSLVLHPGESLEGLAQLPSSVHALIENSPESWEHFRSIPSGEQVRDVSRLLTNVLITCGTAGAGSARAASAVGRFSRLGVPVLTLSAEGTLAVSRVAVPAQSLVTAVSTGTGALLILHMSARGTGSGSGDSGSKRWTPPMGGPGKWVRKGEGMKPGARKYQSQVAGAPEGWVYRVERAGEKYDFDGFKDGTLVDGKGPNYDNKFLDTLEPQPWFKETGARELLSNADRQRRVAKGIPILWHVAESKAARAIRKLLRDNEYLDAIEVIHTPMQP
ncbi:Tox-REase-5 domain-containing protein [Hyalangium sp.]|uniref:Tox-REase-5 domain-containing protein n=1 Tax=Hyalangium sp. TaxID=2028555 RepID=UPI002D4ADEC8|nr:Tox-REase-5 domain-containing protein [Hyalangium sp.]HYH94735.1 Tox-REase-5 domain-containing protein [Hyalangium sp.]